MLPLRSAVLALLAAAVPIFGEETRNPHTDLYGDPLPPGVVARLGTIRLRHADSDAVFSRDGKQIVSCGCDGEVRFWDSASGKLLRRTRLEGMPAKYPRFTAVRLAPGGAMAALTDRNDVCLFETHTGKARGRVHARSLWTDRLLPFSPDGKLVAVLDYHDKSSDLYLWDVNQGKRKQTLEKPCRGFTLPVAVFSPDGKRLAAIAPDLGFEKHLWLWDTTTGKLLAKKDDLRHVDGHALAFSPDGKTLAVGKHSENQVDLLDATDFKKQDVLKAPAGINAEYIDQVIFSPDGRWLAATYHWEATDRESDQSGILVWDRRGVMKPRRLPGRSYRYLDFASDSRTLLSHSHWDSSIDLWDVATGRPRHSRPGHDDCPILGLAVSPDGQAIVSADRHSILLWQAATGKPLQQLERSNGGAHACFFSADGKRLFAVVSGDKYFVPSALRMWETASGKQRLRFNAPEWVLALAAFAVDDEGKRLTVVAQKTANSPREHLIVWDTATGKELLHRPYDLEKRIYADSSGGALTHFEDDAAFTWDGERVTVWLGDRMGIADVTSGQVLAQLPPHVGTPCLSWRQFGERWIAFSSDGQLLRVPRVRRTDRLQYDDKVTGLSVIESWSGEEIFRREGEFWHAAFSPDGRLLLILDDNSVTVWDTDSGEQLARMPWPERMKKRDGQSRVDSLLLLPDGRFLTAMDEGDILVWDRLPRRWRQRRTSPQPSREQFVALWSDLRADAARAHHAMKTLTETPAATVAFLQTELRSAGDGRRLQTLLAELDAPDFEKREAATQELRRFAFRATPLLRRTLAGKPSLECCRRIKEMLAAPALATAEDLQMLRAIAVLERMATLPARRLLEQLADRAPVVETQAAQAALQRLKLRDTATRERTFP